MRLAIDAMGGDHAPQPIVVGVLEALVTDDELSLVLVGDQDQIEPFVDIPDSARSRLSFLHTTDVVGMSESPGKAITTKPKASIFECWNLLAKGEVEGVISAGNTGAVVAGGLKSRRFLPQIKRPGIAVTVPNPTGWSVMIDVGANVHPRPEHLFQYGMMGSVYARQILGVENPTIGLMNVGSEELKGNELAKETTHRFQNSSLRGSFYGNIEGRDVCRGVVDVIVCDGFVGNIVLKCCEGMVDFLMQVVGQEVLGSLKDERDIAKHALKAVHNRYHASEFGGAPLLGIDGVCLICHGASDARAMRNAVRAAKQYSILNKTISQEVANGCLAHNVANV